MKRVYIVRHAQAVGKDLGMPDFERSLEPKGVRDSRKTGKRLARQDLQSAILISSPANRALETAHLVAKELDYPVEKILLKEPVYESSDVSAFIGILRELNDAYSTALLFGHEPSLSEFVSLLSGVPIASMPKAGVIGLEFSDATWTTVSGGDGTIFYLDAPMNKRDRLDAKKKLMKQVERDVANSVLETIESYSPEAAGRLKRVASNAGKEAAERLFKIAGSKKLIRRQLVLQATQAAPNDEAESRSVEKTIVPADSENSSN
ncbi:MAG TPA: histidine phosphatase family protein [candidate division Zixibacteria bacterium]|nr:histidine phosphatase family protein [candidate division Zixibacteria bacterium]